MANSSVTMCVFVIIALLANFRTYAAHHSLPQQRPLTLLQVERLIDNKTPDEVVAGEINTRGMVVRLNDEEIARLKMKGAGSKTIQALQQAKGLTQNSQTVTRKPRLWITYAQENKVTGDFGFLTQELQKAGVDVTYKETAIKKGFLLWEQIAKAIEDKNLDGWAILLTKESLQSELCREELAYALERALSSRGRGFPLLGLAHQVNLQEVPASLRVRGVIDLRNPS